VTRCLVRFLDGRPRPLDLEFIDGALGDARRDGA
jgi:hypothetical protein